MSGTGPGKSAKDKRDERLKQALRANLKRRKQQTRLKQRKRQARRAQIRIDPCALRATM